MTISRALKKAQLEGLVEIRVHLPVQNDPHLEEALKDRLHLKDVFVAYPEEETAADVLRGDMLLDLLGRSTALFIDWALQDGVVLGMALGRTVGHVARHLPQKTLVGAKVVQILGGLGTSSSYNPYDLVQSVSQRLGAKGIYFSGPAFVANAEVQRAMLEENVRVGLRDLWRQCRLCLVGVGSCAPNAPYVTSGLITNEDLAAAAAMGAVGDILGRYYDIHGRFVPTELHQRVNAVPIDDLMAVGQVVVTAGGPEKVRPIIGVARTGLPIALVTDRHTAEAVIAALDGAGGTETVTNS